MKNTQKMEIHKNTIVWKMCFKNFEKQRYMFLNDVLGPVTKRYVGDIDLLRNQKSKLQAEGTFI